MTSLPPLASAPALALALALLHSCQDPESTDDPRFFSESPGLVLPSVIVEPEWLSAHLSDPDLLVVDARSLGDYSGGHLIGAVSLDFEETYSKDPERRYMLGPIDEVSRLFGSRGIGGDETVVIYGPDDSFKPSCRLFWALELLGHSSVGVLNGGPKAWAQAGGEIVSTPTERAPAVFVAEPIPGALATKHDVVAALRSGSSPIIDTRPEAHYLGEDGWLSQPRWGHIPGALHLDPVDSMTIDDGTRRLHVKGEVADAYHKLKHQKLITYCNAGHEATVSYLLFRSLNAQVAVYDGSWCEWSCDATLPADDEGTPKPAVR